MKEENEAIIRALNKYGRVPQIYELLNEIERLNNRIEKAVEYIENNRNKLLLSLPPREALDIDKLLDILNGRSDE